MTYFMSMIPSIFAAMMLIMSQQAGVHAASAINLGSCAGFAVMGGTSVSFNGVTSTIAVGSVGVSPGVSISGSYIMGTGSVEANTAAAISCATSMLTAYNAAVGTTCTNTAAPSDLGGKTLTAGVYCNDGGLFELTSGSLTLSGSATDIFIFQAATSVTTSTATSIILTGGALAENVFWQVGTTLSTGTSSVFVGTVLAGTSITLGSTSTLNGRALAQAAVAATSGNTITSFPTSSTPSNTATADSTSSTSGSTLSNSSVIAIVVMSCLGAMAVIGMLYCAIMKSRTKSLLQSSEVQSSSAMHTQV
jgi:hypothetical protein